MTDVSACLPAYCQPVDAENHNVYIYYPRRLGGGSKRLFRKVGNSSSKFYPEENTIRRDASYLYEAFLMTQGTDIKIYVVGPDVRKCGVGGCLTLRPHAGAGSACSTHTRRRASLLSSTASSRETRRARRYASQSVSL